tara:strand:+ start:1201 stop:1440 length:240 start_codon:yes stop_codon:yes gene_type:complete
MSRSELSPIARQIVDGTLKRIEEAQSHNQPINTTAAMDTVVGRLYATIGNDFAGTNVNNALIELASTLVEKHREELVNS